MDKKIEVVVEKCEICGKEITPSEEMVECQYCGRLFCEDCGSLDFFICDECDKVRNERDFW